MLPIAQLDASRGDDGAAEAAANLPDAAPAPPVSSAEDPFAARERQAQAAPPAPESAFAQLFRRAATPPGGAVPCEPPFPVAYRYVGNDPDTLVKIVWLDRKGRGYMPSSPNVDHADELRCFASGPHTAFNIENWCCRS
jgi:hypothetical protein